jgi:DNA-binding response OmpR family regulator
MQILLIEDSALAAMQMSAAIKALGHEPVVVGDGDTAWTTLTETPFRMVVSDWRLPGLDGLELCRRIRQRDGEYVYFILVSVAKATGLNREEALRAGVDDFLVKPVDPEELRMRLHVGERILGFTRQVRQLESFLPICSYCRKVRDDKNYWSEVEAYFSANAGTTFSHGVCPDCYNRVIMPQLKAFKLDGPPGP